LTPGAVSLKIFTPGRIRSDRKNTESCRSRLLRPRSGPTSVRYQQPKMAKNLPCLWRQLQKKTKPKTKTFFSLHIQGLAESFEGLNSSLAQSAEDLCGW